MKNLILNTLEKLMKRLIISLFTIGLITTSFVSCGKKTKDQQIQEVSIANSYLNSKEYEKAIEVLELAIEKYPEKQEIKVILAHAYAGAGGFEAIVFGRLTEDLAETQLEGSVNEILSNIEDALSKVPHLSAKQKTRLDQAISLYTGLGFDPYSTTGENNFKWGVLHTYRLLVTVKESVNFLREIVENKRHYSEDEIQEFFITKADLFAQDFYKSYQLFKNSFDKIKTIASKIESLIENTVEDDEFKLKIESKATNYRQFVKDVIRDNDEIISAAIANISNKIDLLNIEESIRRISHLIKEGEDRVISETKNITSESSRLISDEIEAVNANESIKQIVLGFEENKEDVDARLERLEILVKLFLENVVLKYPQENEALKRIFNEELVNDAESALELAIHETSLEPIKIFIESRESNIKTIVDAWEILSSEYDKSQISDIADPDVRALLSYIDTEEAKRLEERAEKAAKEIKNITDNSVDEIRNVNSDTLEEVSEAIEDEINTTEDAVNTTVDEIENIIEVIVDELENNNQEVEDELNLMLRKDAEELKAEVRPYTEDIEEALEAQDKEMEEKAQDIINHTIEYIEQE
jgi:hypothetical protein